MTLAPERPLVGAARPRICHLPKDATYGAGEEATELAASAGLVLDEWQSWTLTQAMATKADGDTWAAFEVGLLISRQNGKNPAALDTHILSTAGWTTVGDIRPGQHVYGSDGQPVLVTGVTEVVRDEPCFEVRFTDGSAYTVTENHKWPVRHRSRGTWGLVTTRELARDVAALRRDGKKDYSWRIRCDAVPQTPPANLPVDPYLLGYWLGDGASKAAIIFSHKSDLDWVQAAVASAGFDAQSVRVHPTTGVQEINFSSHQRGVLGDFAARCRALDIWGTGRKRIPEGYLTASPEQRLALLRGLMDSDGSIAVTNRSPQAEYTTCLPGLAEDMWRLLRSLGVRVTRPTLKPTSCNGKPGAGRFRFLFTAAVNPFALPRKAECWRPPMTRQGEIMSVTGVEPVASVPARCIQVAAADHTFLLGHSFTPTGNSILEARELYGLFTLREPLIIHTAHEFKAAAEHFRRVRALVEGHGDFRREVAGIRTSHGEEAIELRPTPTLILGASGKMVRRSVAPRLRFLARSRGSGRSFSSNCLIYDEAMILTDEQVGASMPTLSAVPNPQLWYTASAGYPDSTQLARVRNRGLAGTDDSLVWLEWSIDPHHEFCQPGCTDHDEVGDEASWAKANPGLGIRISRQHVQREYVKMSSGQFERERLGVGDWPVDENAWAVISKGAWDSCVNAEAFATRPARVAIAVDVTPDQRSGTIAIAAYHPDHMTVEIGKTVPSELFPEGLEDHRAGTAWIVPRLKELKQRHDAKIAAIVIDPIGPAAALLVEAEKAGLDITVPTVRDITQGFAQFYTLVAERKLAHQNEPALRAAVAGATRRQIGDGLFAWARKSTTVDLSPLCAATMAAWAANKFGRGYDLLKSIA